MFVRYYVSRKYEAGGIRGLQHKEKRMSREDDFDDTMDSPDETDTGQDDTSEPLLEDESVDESPTDEARDVEPISPVVAESTEKMPPARKTAKKKKKAVPKAKKKKTAKPARKPAAKKVVKKKVAKKKTTAKKKTRPAAKKKKTARKAGRKR